MRQSKTDATEQLNALPRLGIEALRALWVEQFGRVPSLRARKDLLVRMLAYRLQENAHGGLSPTLRKRLRALAGRIDSGNGQASRPTPRLTVGTRLIREWKGQTHVVSVLEDGVEYRDKRYGSLSEVARAITGTRWSGPAFFGLKPPSSSEQSG
jgi:Protein of unknown function (DUF2924)